MRLPRSTRFALLVLVRVAVPLAASPLDQRISHLEQEVHQASESGAYARVRALRRELVQHFISAERYADAARQIELMLASRPPRNDRVDLFLQLGKIREKLNEPARAVEAFQNAQHDNPKSFEATFLLGRALAMVELDNQALRAFKKCLAWRPQDRETLQQVGHVYQRLGYLDEALSYYARALKISPQPETYLGMAECLVRQGETMKAIDLLKGAQSASANTEYEVRLGEIYRREGQLEKAVASWERVLQAAPDRDDVGLMLVMALEEVGRRVEAERRLQNLKAKYPQSPLVHFVHAWMWYQRGQKLESKKEALRARQLAPTEVVRYYTEALLKRIP